MSRSAGDQSDRKLSDTIDDALAPRVLIADRYEVERELGKGGMGRVLLAFDSRLGRKVAIKMLAPGNRSEIALRRFELEARAAGALNHPNILDVHDIGLWNGEPYIVSELLEGEPLSERLRRGPLTSTEAIGYAIQLGEGLVAAHEKGIVHRDLKPENLFVTISGRLKILDFGIAKLIERPAEGGGPVGAAPQTDSGTVLGTFRYMSPEQIRGQPVDERSDIFTCGTILYEMATGSPAFAFASSVEIGYAILNGNPPEMPGHVPAGFAAVVRRCWEKDPAQRFQSAREMGAQLGTLAAAHGPTADHHTDDRMQPSQARPSRKRKASLALAAVVFAAAGFVTYRFVPGRGGTAPEITPSIAVLPFADLSAGKDQEYFSDGLADEILDALVHVEGLRVAGRTSSFSFKGKDEDVQAIGRKLHVSAILKGSVRKDGSWLRITAQLVEANEGFHVWSKTFDRTPSGIFAVQEEISNAVVEALREHFHLDARARSSAPKAVLGPAYAEYLIGRQLLNRGSAGGQERAMEAFEKAVKLDASYAPAWVGLATAAYYWSNLGAEGPAEAERARRRAVEAANKAVTLGPNLGEAWAVRSYLRGLTEFDWEGAQKDLDNALRLNSGDAEVRRRLGLLLASLGRLPEALAAVRKSAELDPLAADAWDNLGYVANASGDYATARDASARALEIAPEQAYAAMHAAVADLLEGNPVRALAIFEKSGEELLRLQGIAMAQHDLSNEGASQRALGQLTAKHGYNSAFQIAQAYAWRGDADRAFEWLERGYQQRDGGLGYLKCDPLLRKIRGDVRYASLLRRMKLPE